MVNVHKYLVSSVILYFLVVVAGIDDEIYLKLANEYPEVTFTPYYDESQFLPNSLIIMDDLSYRLSTDLKERVCNLACNTVHHRSISLCLCMHEIFIKSLRLLFLNSNYLLLFNFPRDQSSISMLARQIAPKRAPYLTAAYQCATRSPFGYLFCDFNVLQNKHFRFRSSIFDDEDTLVFAPVI